jgi:hypothetical protein
MAWSLLSPGASLNSEECIMTARPLTILPFAILLTLTLTVDATAQYVDPLTANHDGFWLEWIMLADSTIADVALADADDDGDPDLFVVDGSTLELWRNDGRGRFVPDPLPLCPIPLTRILTVEIGGNNRVDVIGAPVRGGLVFLNGLGFGAFGSPEILSSNSEYSVLTAIDLDGDGAIEIACGGQPNAGLEIIPGPRSMVSPSAWFAGLTVGALAVADPNHDQRQDLVMSTTNESFEDSVVVLLNLPGFPTYATPGRHSDEGGSQILPFDFNGDGFQDLVVSAWGGLNFDVLLGDGTGAHWQTRKVEQESSTESVSNFAVYAQPDQDPLLLTGWRSGNAAFLGVFDPRADPDMASPALYSYAQSYQSSVPPSRILSTDVDGDGLQDVVLVTFAASSWPSTKGRIGMITGRTHSLGGLRVAPVDVRARRLAATRVHASEPPRLVLSTWEEGVFMASLREDGTLAPTQRIGDGRIAHAIDLNNDAMDDLIVEQPDGTSDIRFMDPDGPGPVATRLDGVVIAIGDLDEDRMPELLLRRRDDTLCVVSARNGEFRYASATHIFLSQDFEAHALVTIGDPDGDGRRELIEGRFHRPGRDWDAVLDTVATYRWAGDSLQVVERSLIWNVNPDPYNRAREIYSADMDGERGDEIVVLIGFDQARLRILKPTFRGFHWLIGDCRIGYENPRLALADFDGDGDVDAACVSNFDGSEGLLRIGWNDGSGTLNAEWVRRVGYSQMVDLAAQDFDGDGITDLAILAPNRWGEDPPAHVGFLYGRRGDSPSKRVRRIDRTALPTRNAVAPAIHAITPNPARGAFAIRWSVPASGPAAIDLLDVAGRRVRGAPVDSRGARDGEARFDGLERLPAGLYWVRLRQGRQTVTKRVALIR